MTKVVITGGSGFIGSNLVQELVDRDYDVVNLDIRPPAQKVQTRLWRYVTLLDQSATRKLLEEIRPKYVIHAAARADLGGTSLADYQVNTTGTSNLIDGVEASGSVRRTLVYSSMLVCRNGYSPGNETEYCPNTLYGQSKVAMERIVRDRMGSGKSDFVIVRPTSVWGPWFSAPYRHFFEAIERGVYVHPRGALVRKQFAYVGNVVDQTLKLLTAPHEKVSERVFYVGDYVPYIVREWADTIQRELGAQRIRAVPLSALKCAAALGDLLVSLGWRRAPLTRFRLSNMLLDNSVPFDNTASICGGVKYTVHEGVRQTVSWLREQATRRER